MRAPPALFAKNAPVAQLDRASDYESEGRTFESFRARQFQRYFCEKMILGARTRGLSLFSARDNSSLRQRAAIPART
jgi:hypothetical protein